MSGSLIVLGIPNAGPGAILALIFIAALFGLSALIDHWRKK